MIDYFKSTKNYPVFRNFILWGFALIVITGTVSCASRSVDSNTTMDELPESFTQSGEKTLNDRWWKHINDENLNELMNRALEDNFSLKQAWNRLKEARAVVTAQTSELYPGLDVTGTRKYRNSDPPSARNLPDKSTTLKGIAKYEVDLWNRIESSVEAAKYNEKASREELQSAAISLTAEVARTWYQLVETYRQERILENQLQVNQDFQEIVSNRYSNGQSQLADLLRQRRLKQGTRERLISTRSRMETLENKLAVLLGQTPEKTVNPKIEEFPDLSNLPETGLPSKTINQRPDVKAAFYQVQSADRDVASAIANQYPRLNLTGTISTDGADAGTLFENWLRSVAADLTVPIIDSEKREAEVSRNKAILSRRLNEYRETVLTAFQEVEDAIVGEEQKRKQLEKIYGQLKSSRQTEEILWNRYVNGNVDFLSVLDAIKTKQQLQRDLTTAKRELMIDRIGLYRSLSGGWAIKESKNQFTKSTTTGD